MSKLFILTGFASEKDFLNYKQYPYQIYSYFDAERFFKNKKDNMEITLAIREQIKWSLKRNYNVVAILPNLSKRKTRADFYKNIKAEFPTVEISTVIFHSPYSKLMEIEEFSKLDEFSKKYKSFQVPRVDVDTDKIEVNAPDFKEYKEEIEETINLPHYSPYHKETIQEHINLTIENAKKSESQYKDLLVEIATYHDFGKSFCRTDETPSNELTKAYFEKTGKFNRFKNHEYLGAVYYLIAKKDKANKFVLEAILQHMNEVPLHKKNISKNKLSPKLIKLIEEFKEIDHSSRIKDII